MNLQNPLALGLIPKYPDIRMNTLTQHIDNDSKNTLLKGKPPVRHVL